MQKMGGKPSTLELKRMSPTRFGSIGTKIYLKKKGLQAIFPLFCCVHAPGADVDACFSFRLLTKHWEACVLSWIRPGLGTGCSFKHFQERTSRKIHVQKVGTLFSALTGVSLPVNVTKGESLSVQNCGLLQNKAALQDV